MNTDECSCISSVAEVSFSGERQDQRRHARPGAAVIGGHDPARGGGPQSSTSLTVGLPICSRKIWMVAGFRTVPVVTGTIQVTTATVAVTLGMIAVAIGTVPVITATIWVANRIEPVATGTVRVAI